MAVLNAFEQGACQVRVADFDAWQDQAEPPLILDQSMSAGDSAAFSDGQSNPLQVDVSDAGVVTLSSLDGTLSGDYGVRVIPPKLTAPLQVADVTVSSLYVDVVLATTALDDAGIELSGAAGDTAWTPNPATPTYSSPSFIGVYVAPVLPS